MVLYALSEQNKMVLLKITEKVFYFFLRDIQPTSFPEGIVENDSKSTSLHNDVSTTVNRNVLRFLNTAYMLALAFL